MIRPLDQTRAVAQRSVSTVRHPRRFRPGWVPAAIGLLLISGGEALADLPIASAVGIYDLRAATWDTREPRRVCQDFFCNVFTLVPPENVVDAKVGSMGVQFNPTLFVPDSERTSEFATAPLAGIASTSSAKLGIGSTTVDFGVAASATKSSVFNGEAEATLRTAYFVTVELRSRGLLGSLTAGACGTGCTLAMDFMHQTTGRFIHSGTPGTGARASFSESLSINGRLQTSGEAYIETGPSAGQLPSPGAAGAWNATDFLAPQSTAAGTEWTFNHFAQITDQRAQFAPSDMLDEDGNVVFSGRYLITVEQKAKAAFGAFQYIVGSSTMSADFDDTSSFTPGQIYDPTGVLDLTGAHVNVSFVSVSPVPEPATWAMLAAGLGLTLRSLRRRSTRSSSGC